MTGRAHLAAAAAILAAMLSRPAAAQFCHPNGRTVLVTVAGDVAVPNRAGNSPLDQFATRQDHNFTRARNFNGDDLATLPMVDVKIVLPYDGKRYVFTGPTLMSVLQAAGAEHGGVTIAGLDGHKVEYSAADIARLKPILALCRDHAPLGIGDLGPGFVVYSPKLQDTPDDAEMSHMIWGVYWVTTL